MAILEKELEEIGLNEKEAKVYLASLELGQSTVQKIAKKSEVNRATAYFIIDALMKRGLMSSFHKGKKQYFLSADPDRLIDFLEKEKENIEVKKKNLKKLLPELQSINNKQTDRPVVKYYEGKDGIFAMVNELTRPNKETIRMAFSKDIVDLVFNQKELMKMRNKRVDINNNIKAIYTYKNGILESKTGSDIRRKIPSDKFPIKSDIAVYDNSIRLASFGNRMVGIVIEDKELSETFRSILDLAWEAAEKYDLKK
jgi:HTH-type transcriptional regulator, sugar sensing transcriptional regulator